jgi:mediator of RNA polymerase II transcription subunit 13
VGKTAALKLGKEPVDEWFTMLGDNPATNMLKLYAQVSTSSPNEDPSLTS